jgi:hypothetical protein
VIQSKINITHTDLANTNFWSPLDTDDENELDDDTREEPHKINSAIISNVQKSNKWMRRFSRRQEKKIIIDSGATSHFMTEDLDLPTKGVSNKEVFLPNDTRLRTSRRTQLPFDTLTTAAREADILPGLKRSLLSVSKMSDEGYTTIFHPGEEGVTIHKKGTIRLTTSEPPVLKQQKLHNKRRLFTTYTAYHQYRIPYDIFMLLRDSL